MFVEIKLSFQTRFSIDVFPLKLAYKVIFQLNLLQTRIVSSVSLRSLNTVLLLLGGQYTVSFLELLNLFLVGSVLVLDLSKLIVFSLHFVFLLPLLFLSVDNILAKQFTLTHLRFDLFFQIFDHSGGLFLLFAFFIVLTLLPSALSYTVFILLLCLCSLLGHRLLLPE